MFKEFKAARQELQDLRRQVKEGARDLRDDLLRLEAQIDALGSRLDEEHEYLSPEYVRLCLRSATKKQRVLICGFYGAKNTGDELMLRSLLKILEACPNLEITILLSNNYELDASEYAPYEVIHFPAKSSDILVLAQYFDCVILGGGALLDDRDYKFRGRYSATAYLILTLLKAALNCHKKTLVLGASANQALTDPHFLEDLQFVIDNSAFFSLRDTYSLRSLKAAHLNTERVQIIDDLALATPINPLPHPLASNFTVGFSLIIDSNTIDAVTAHIEAAADLLQELYPTKDLYFKFIPFYSYHDSDLAAYQMLIAKLQPLHPNITYEITPQPNTTEDLTKIYDTCDRIIAMRYHATLIAVAGNYPTLLLDLSKYHPHYFNKNHYLAKQYCPDLPVISLGDLKNSLKTLRFFLKTSDQPKSTVPDAKVIADNLCKIIQKGGLQ